MLHRSNFHGFSRAEGPKRLIGSLGCKYFGLPHNIDSTTKAIDRLRAEGQTISDEVLAAVSPYQTSHINRFGQYQLRVRLAPDSLPFPREPSNVEISTVDSPGLAATG
jgi:hypothetical protein